MRILDESGNLITGTPDFSTGRYLQNSDGDLVFTKYTDAELAEIKEKEESNPEYRISSLETLVLQLGGII